MIPFKKIFCFGTSLSCGGGFEWDSNDQKRNKLLEENYGYLKIRDQHKFSYPYHLQQLINKLNNVKIKVENFAKSGYGNERICQSIYNLITTNEIDEETLLLVEFSDFGRLQLYDNHFEKDFIVNYHFEDNTEDLNFSNISLAYEYFYDNKIERERLKEIYNTISNFLDFYIDMKYVPNKISMNTFYLVSTLDNLNIPYIIVSDSMLLDGLHNKLKNYNKLKVDYDIGNGKSTNILWEYIVEKQLSIKHETNKKYNDFHAGYRGNIEISKQIYKKISEVYSLGTLDSRI